MSQVEGGRFARVGSHLPTEPSSRPRPSREKFGLNASTMVSCARHSEGKEGEKEGRNCGGAASFSFSLAAQVFFRRFTGRSGSKEKNQEACACGSRGRSEKRPPSANATTKRSRRALDHVLRPHAIHPTLVNAQRFSRVDGRGPCRDRSGNKRTLRFTLRDGSELGIGRGLRRTVSDCAREGVGEISGVILNSSASAASSHSFVLSLACVRRNSERVAIL